MSEAKELHEFQASFLDAQEPFVGLFGGVGNGKTYAGSLAIIEHSTANPKNLCLVGRLTYPELRDSTREVFMGALAECLAPEAYTFNRADNSLTFWNGSQVIFRHLDNQASLLGPNLGAFYIDQAEEVDEEAFLTLQSRLRRSGVKHLQGYITGNPQGHNWVYYKFGMDEAGAAKNWKHGQDYRMITAPTHANKTNLPQDYIDQLKRSYSPEWYERYVMGSWDAFEGQIFDLTKITGYEKLPKIKMVLTACDPAISKDKDACNTAFCTIGIGEDNHFYDLETIAGKWTFLETLEEAKKLLSRQKPTHLGVESVAYQKALFEACQRYFPQIQVCDLKADKDKFRRAKSVSHIVGKGLFHTNNRELLNELSAFLPDQKGKERKDRVDALVHALHMAQQYGPFEHRLTDPFERFKDMNSHQMWFTLTREWAKKRERGEENITEFNPSLVTVDPEFY